VSHLDDPRRSVAGLHLGAWHRIQHRLLPRLIWPGRAGPLAQSPVPSPSGRGRPAVLADVGIDVTGGIVRVGPGLLRNWGVEPDEVWAAAATNLAARPRPAVAVVSRGPVRLRLAVAGPWTTGWLTLADPLAALGLGDEGNGPVVGLAPAPDLVLLADRPEGRGRPRERREGTAGAGPAGRDLIEALVDLGARLIGSHPAPLPLQPLLLGRAAPFPPRRILE
jgi:hypothetical protein